MRIPKKFFPPSVPSTFSIFITFQTDALKIQIEFENFKKVLPAFCAEHIFDLHHFSNRCKQHARRILTFQKSASRPRWGAHFSFLPTFITSQIPCKPNLSAFVPFLSACLGLLASSWDAFGPYCGQLGANLGHLGANLGQLGANLSQLVANLGQLGANLGQLEPTWS